jgi:gluconolactonase
VYRYLPDEGTLDLLDEGMIFANGIAFGTPEELFVTESETGMVYRYSLGADGLPTGRDLVIDVVDRARTLPAFCGPDGLTVADDGHLFVCVFGQGEVAVVEPGGTVVERLAVGGAMPTNCTFGPDGRLYVTELQQGALVALSV